MTSEDQLCDDILKINVRNHEYVVSKKLICSRVPYFEKMLRRDQLRLKENTVQLDFDDRVFTSILSWIRSGALEIHMDYVISLYNAADYLKINDKLFNSCFTHFYDKFTIEHIPVVLQQVTRTSKLINTEAIASIICRYFLMMAYTDIFLNFSVETVEAILKLDLMIHSEYQIFDVIMNWVEKDPDSRSSSIEKLFKYVRWSSMDLKGSEALYSCREFYAWDLAAVQKYSRFFYKFIAPSFFFPDDPYGKDFADLLASRSSILSHDDYRFPRSKQNFLISIHQKDDANLSLKVYDSEFYCLPIGDFTFDGSMSLEFFHGENISDILFESGTRGIRVDWAQRTFKWLDFKVKAKTYYSQLIKFVSQFPSEFTLSPDIDPFSCYLTDARDIDIGGSDFIYNIKEGLLLEYNESFILIGKTQDNKWFGGFPVRDSNYFINFKDHDHSFKATVLDNVVYILTKGLEFYEFDIKSRAFYKQMMFECDDSKFDDLILASRGKFDDKVIVINKASGKVFVYSSKEEEWTAGCEILNLNLCNENSNAGFNKLVGFTSTFLPIKVIKTLYTKNVISRTSENFYSFKRKRSSQF